jgi:hypothetical protein
MCFLECAGDDRGAPTLINSAVMMFKVPCPSRIESNEMIEIHNAEVSTSILHCEWLLWIMQRSSMLICRGCLYIDSTFSPRWSVLLSHSPQTPPRRIF